MRIKLKHEVFAGEVAKGRTMGDAAQIAGIGKTLASSKSMASRLMKLPEIRARIDVERKKHNLPPRRAEFVRAYVGGATSSEAAVLAGYQSKPGSQAARILTDPQVVATMKQKMDVAGVTDDLCLEKILEGLNATKPVVVDGKIVDYPDYPARSVFLDKALRLRGHYRNDNPETQTVVNIINHVKLDMMRKAGELASGNVVDATAKEMKPAFTG